MPKIKKSILITLIITLQITGFVCMIINANAQTTPVLSKYLGGIGHNHVVGVAVLNSNSIAVAGNFKNVDQANQDVYFNFFGATNISKARILIVNAASGDYELVLNLGNEIYDFKAKDDYAFVAGDFGIAKINIFTNQIIWQTGLLNKGVAKIDIDVNGNVAVLMNKNIYLLNAANGTTLGNYNVGHNYCNDIAVNNSKIYVTGYDSKINSGYTPCSLAKGDNFDPLDVAFIDAFSYSPTNGTTYGGNKIKFEFSTYNFEGNDLACDMSNTRGYKLEIGKDGFLYLLGETDGPKNIFRWNGKTNWKLNGGMNPTPTHSSGSYDNYHNVNNFVEGNTAQFVGRVDKNTGEVMRGYFSSTILPYTNVVGYISSDNGALYSSSDGKLYVGSMAGSDIPNRNNLLYFNQSLAPYSGGDPSLMTISGMNNTLSWEAFTGQNGKGSVVGIDIESNNSFSNTKLMAVVGTLYAGNAITNKGYTQAFNKSATDNMDDAFLVVYKISTAVTSALQMDGSNKFVENSECIMISCPDKIFHYQIYDLRGILYKEGTYEGEQLKIDKAEFSSGVYFIRIQQKETYSTHKFVI